MFYRIQHRQLKTEQHKTN